MTVELREKVGLGEVRGNRKWYVRIIAKGKGSSGVYTEAALRDTGPAAFPAGTKINMDHQSWSEFVEQPAGSLKHLVGVTVETPEYIDNGDDPAGLYTEVEFSEEWGPFVEQFHEFIGLSISASGYGEDFDDEGARIIEGLIPSPLNTVDLVTVAGAKGALLRAVEQYREDSGRIPTGVETNAANRKDEALTPEQLETLIESVKEAIASGFTTLQESLTPEPVVETDEDTVSISDVTEAIIASDLPEKARVRVYETMKTGSVTLDEAIATEKTYIDSLRETLVSEDNPGTVKEAASGSFDPTVKGW